jgi:hypothetical protein
MKLLAEDLRNNGGIFARNLQPPFELLDRGNLAPFFTRHVLRSYKQIVVSFQNMLVQFYQTGKKYLLMRVGHFYVHI